MGRNYLDESDSISLGFIILEPLFPPKCFRDSLGIADFDDGSMLRFVDE